MAVRPYLTTGAAIVSAGALIAALPAIVPSPTPPDVKVAAGVPKNPYLNDVKLQASLQELVDIFFDTGFDGLTRQFLLDIVGTYQPSIDAINGFFDIGASDVVRQWLVNNNSVPAEQQLINDFFNGVPIDPMDPESETFPAGFTELVRQWLQWNNADPATAEGIDAFFGGGASAFAHLFLSANVVPGSPEAEWLDTFFDSGFDGLAEMYLLAATPGPSVNQELIKTFFDRGFDGLAHEFILAATPDPVGKALVNTFFADGFDGLAATFALAAVQGDPVATGLVQSFFSGYPFGEDSAKAGFVGVTHFIIDALIGGVVPPPEPIAPLSVEENADLTKVSTTPDLDAKVSTLDVKIDEKVETKVELDPDEAVTPAAETVPAPAAQPVAVPAPETTTPATPAPVTPVVDDGDVDETLTEEGEEGAVENPGNKFTPPILVFGNNGGKRDNPWRQAWNDTIKTVTGGGATTPDAEPDNTGDPE